MGAFQNHLHALYGLPGGLIQQVVSTTIDTHDFVPKKKRKKKRDLSREVQEGLEALQLLDLQREAIEAEIYRLSLDKKNKAQIKALKAKKRQIEKEREEEEMFILLLMDCYD